MKKKIKTKIKKNKKIKEKRKKKKKKKRKLPWTIDNTWSMHSKEQGIKTEVKILVKHSSLSTLGVTYQ